MQVVLRYFDGCPNWETARERLEEALHTIGVSTEVRLEQVTSQEQAERLRFVGSPTILVDGRDPFPAGDEGFGLTCRVYWSDAGASGSPTVGQLVEALSAPAR